jgi:hypothetical protein
VPHTETTIKLAQRLAPRCAAAGIEIALAGRAVFQAVFQREAAALLNERPSAFNELAEAINYALNHWDGLTLFLRDGRVEVDSNSVERSMRPIAMGGRNSLFSGSEGGAESWAILASLVNTAKLDELDPQAYLTDVSERIVSGQTKSHRLRVGKVDPTDRARSRRRQCMSTNGLHRRLRDGSSSSNPTYLAARERISVGMRMAGLRLGNSVTPSNRALGEGPARGARRSEVVNEAHDRARRGCRELRGPRDGACRGCLVRENPWLQLQGSNTFCTISPFAPPRNP